jgi:hypothetical protein
MDDAYKKMLISYAITKLIDELNHEKGIQPLSNELGDWCHPTWNNKDKVYNTIVKRENGGFMPKVKLEQEYPNFWDDLWFAILQVKIDGSIRSEREVT